MLSYIFCITKKLRLAMTKAKIQDVQSLRLVFIISLYFRMVDFSLGVILYRFYISENGNIHACQCPFEEMDQMDS